MGVLRLTNETLSRTLENAGKAQEAHLEAMKKQLNESAESNRDALDKIRTTLDARVKDLQESNETKLHEVREQVSDGLKLAGDSLSQSLEGLGKMQEKQLEGMTKQLKDLRIRTVPRWIKFAGHLTNASRRCRTGMKRN